MLGTCRVLAVSGGVSTVYVSNFAWDKLETGRDGRGECRMRNKENFPQRRKAAKKVRRPRARKSWLLKMKPGLT